jgi:hypothetical protein
LQGTEHAASAAIVKIGAYASLEALLDELYASYLREQCPVPVIRHTTDEYWCVRAQGKSPWRSAFATASDFECTRSFSYTCRMWKETAWTVRPSSAAAVL